MCSRMENRKMADINGINPWEKYLTQEVKQADDEEIEKLAQNGNIFKAGITDEISREIQLEIEAVLANDNLSKEERQQRIEDLYAMSDAYDAALNDFE